MKRISLLRRMKSAHVAPGRLVSGSRIAPGRCPAIQQASRLGVEIISPIDLQFHNAQSFEVSEFLDPEGRRLLVPGLIGDPEAKRNYARIDSGFSIEDNQIPFLTVLPTSLADDVSGYSQPTVYYGVGYSGPILIALSSTLPAVISSGVPISHLVPLSDEPVSVVVLNEDTLGVGHPEFEGLLPWEWPEGVELVKSGVPKSVWGVE
jgi:hypothetical protein